MKVYVQIPAYHSLVEFLERSFIVMPGFINGWLPIEHLGMLVKSGSHPAETGTALPSKEAPAESEKIQVLPRILLAFRKNYWQTDIGHLGKAVGQLLISGYADYSKSQNLLMHLAQLARECENIRQVLLGIPEDVLRRVDEEAVSKT